ncbi:MAG: hypothetical protein AAGF11_42175 [Myxococcota bacterium]
MHDHDSNAEALLRHLLVEDREHEDPWHALTTGELTRRQVIERRRDLETPEALERKLEIFAPPSEEENDRITHALFGPQSMRDSNAPRLISGADQDDGGVVSIEPERKKRSWWTPTLVIAAAAAVVVLALPPERSPQPLTAFDLQLRDGWAGETRSATKPAHPAIASCDQHYHRDGLLAAHLFPTEPLDDDLRIAVFAQPETGEGRWLAKDDLAPSITQQGVLSIEQPVAPLGLTPGTWTLTFYVVRRDEAHHDDLSSLAPGVHPGVTVVQGTVCIID